METTAAEVQVEAPAKKGKGGRKALKQKNPSTNEANILAGSDINDPISSLPSPKSDPQKENSNARSKKDAKAGKKSKSSKAVKDQAATAKTADPPSFEKQLMEMQMMMEKMKIEKEKTEEMLRIKEEELESKDKEQEKLQLELKKLRKMKEFKPTVSFPLMESLAEKDLEKKDKKKKGCPEKKKPASPYFLWCKDQWNEVKKENPDADFKEMSNILSAKWKTISPEEKKPYEEKYQAKKEAYLQVVSKEKRENEAMKLLEEEQKHKTAMELLEQYLQFKQEAEKDNKEPKKEKDPLKPKQPMSAFFLFVGERRAELFGEGKTLLEVSKITGEEWKKMTEEQKRPYEERAREMKEKYLVEMEAYKQKKEEESANLKKEEEEHMKIQKFEALQLLKKKEKTENIIKKAKDDKRKKQKEEKNNDPNKPKRPLSSYLLFSMEARKRLLEERPGINNSMVTALISEQWKGLSDEEKQPWNKKASDAREAYKKEMEEYNRKAAESSKA